MQRETGVMPLGTDDWLTPSFYNMSVRLAVAVMLRVAFSYEIHKQC